MDQLIQWTIGLLVTSVVGGGLVVEVFIKKLRKYMNVSTEDIDQMGTKGAPAWLTGGIERLFFTTLIGFNISGVPAAMLIWLTLKMVTNWNSPYWKERDIKKVRLAFSALLAGVVSMFFALLGGVIILGTF